MIKVKKAARVADNLIVRIVGISYNTPRNRYQGGAVETFPHVALHPRRTLCDYWFMNAIIHNHHILVRSR
jgi:hypothetical protein